MYKNILDTEDERKIMVIGFGLIMIAVDSQPEINCSVKTWPWFNAFKLVLPLQLIFR